MDTDKNVVLLDESNYVTWHPQIKKALKRDGLRKFCSMESRVLTPFEEMQSAKAAVIIMSTVSEGLLLRIPKQDLLNAPRLLSHLKRFAKPFRFLELSPELRNVIYEYYFPRKQNDGNDYYHLYNDAFKPIETSASRMPALTQVCKQLRRETRPLYFGLCPFYFDFKYHFGAKMVDHAIQAIQRWTRQVAGPDVRYMRQLEILMGDDHWYNLNVEETRGLTLDVHGEEGDPPPEKILQHLQETEVMRKTLNLKGEALLMFVIQKPSIWV